MSRVQAECHPAEIPHRVAVCRTCDHSVSHRRIPGKGVRSGLCRAFPSGNGRERDARSGREPQDFGTPDRRGLMLRYDSEELIRRYGFEKGLELLNVLTARDLGMIPEWRAVRFVTENIRFFAEARPRPIPEMN